MKMRVVTDTAVERVHSEGALKAKNLGVICACRPFGTIVSSSGSQKLSERLAHKLEEHRSKGL